MKSPRPARQYVLIGAGVAAISAAQSIRRLDPSGAITLVTDDPAGYYSRPGLAYYLTGELGEDVLFPLTKKDYRELNLQWVNKRVEHIIPGEHQVLLEDGRCLAYDRLLIATGAQAAPLTVPGAAYQGVVKLDHIDDARAILRQCRRARAAVVVGGGITALELVEGLHAQGLKVHYLLRGERYWSNVLDSHESELVQARLLEKGVRIYYNTELAEVLGERQQVTSVRTKDGQQIACEIVAVAIGVLPRKGLALDAGLQVERGVLVNELLQTSHPDIFAAGDVAQGFDPLIGKSALDTLWNTARQQGRAAGQNMAGRRAVYRKQAPFNITRLAGLTTTIIGTVGQGVDLSLKGIARGDSETWRQLPIHSIAETRDTWNRTRLLVGERRLLGAVVMGDQSLSLPLQALIARQVDISPIRRPLLQDARLGDIITTYWDQWRVTDANTRT